MPIIPIPRTMGGTLLINVTIAQPAVSTTTITAIGRDGQMTAIGRDGNRIAIGRDGRISGQSR